MYVSKEGENHTRNIPFGWIGVLVVEVVVVLVVEEAAAFKQI